MKAVMGSMNGVRLLDLMNAATSKCSRATAAVAYATNNTPFFDHCLGNKIFLDYFGLLDEDQAVAIPVLQKLVEAGPLAVNCRLIKGHFHSKIIWWHGFGVYIGSANLTSNAWAANVECGVFYEEAEIAGTQLQIDLEQQFDYLRVNSSPVTSELVRELGKIRPHEEAVYRAKNQVRSQFELATKNIPPHAGLASYGPSIRTTAFTRFTSEWSETLELLRGLSREFLKLNLRPKWVSTDAEPAVHFDQFLHAYYYVRIRDEKEDEDSAKSVELVNRAYLKHRANPSLALEDAGKWWSSLPKAPYGEDVFIRDTAPRIRASFAKENLPTWTLENFQETFFEVHAFKTHARQVRNSFFGLHQGHRESARERSDRLATWLWEQRREPNQQHILDVLQFLFWGTSPENAVERLWIVTTDENRRFDHLGPSSLGEALGWARPDKYPPRNNRTNKALRSLGHDVRLFSD